MVTKAGKGRSGKGERVIRSGGMTMGGSREGALDVGSTMNAGMMSNPDGRLYSKQS